MVQATACEVDYDHTIAHAGMLQISSIAHSEPYPDAARSLAAAGSSRGRMLSSCRFSLTEISISSFLHSAGDSTASISTRSRRAAIMSAKKRVLLKSLRALTCSGTNWNLFLSQPQQADFHLEEKFDDFTSIWQASTRGSIMCEIVPHLYQITYRVKQRLFFWKAFPSNLSCEVGLPGTPRTASNDESSFMICFASSWSLISESRSHPLPSASLAIVSLATPELLSVDMMVCDATERCCKEPPMSRRLRRGRNATRVAAEWSDLPLRCQNYVHLHRATRAPRAPCGDGVRAIARRAEVAACHPAKKLGEFATAQRGRWRRQRSPASPLTGGP